MDTFNFDFDTDSTLTNDTNSTNSDLDWTAAFQSATSSSSSSSIEAHPQPSITVHQNPFSSNWLAQHDDAVAPDNRTNHFNSTTHDDGLYFEIERFFNGLNQQEQQHQQDSSYQQQEEQGVLSQPIHANTQIPDQINHNETSYRTQVSLPAPLVPRVSPSSRSQCYHKLPEHAVKLMQEWYNAHLDDPYPRSPDKKRFITEGNITAQQCRSWFANRRQRLKHVKRNQPKTLTTRLDSIVQKPLIDEQIKQPEQCYYCQQQPTPPSSSQVPTTTTVNVVINQQTVEQLIQNSLRKLFYAPVM